MGSSPRAPHDPRDPLAPLAVRSAGTVQPHDPLALGPLAKVYLIWLPGASCEGCTVAVVGATHPRIEQLLTGAIPGLPRVELVHTVLATESGAEWTENLWMAERGELDAPHILTCEGSVMDESRAGDGHWLGLGQDPATGRQVTSREWLDRLAPGAVATIAVGTCATWGGIPAAKGNPTNATGVGDHLGVDYRSAAGVPVVNIPGCAPLGDNFVETASALLLHLNGLAPFPELDELGRPSWLFADNVHAGCPRARYYEQGVFAAEAGSSTCLVELGCHGPVVQCNIAERGVIDGNGGCMSMGGICIGCTMPGFPDRFAPFFETPTFETPAETTTRVPGGFLRRMRAVRGRHPTPEGHRANDDHGTSRRPLGAASAPRFYRAGAGRSGRR
ncbi:MAG: hydrogenase expression protein HypE [Actinomycetota bacterium]|nr:hydrogenase expression protein HypE [Actinomycetota bacterium]